MNWRHSNNSSWLFTDKQYYEVRVTDQGYLVRNVSLTLEQVRYYQDTDCVVGRIEEVTGNES